MARSISLTGAPPAGALRVYRTARRARLRLVLPALALLALLLGGAFMWFRSSSFVAITEIRLQGLTGPEAGSIGTALRSAAETMTTMRASDQALLASVSSYPVVRDVTMKTAFPHKISISVTERRPAAVLSADGAREAVAADGIILGAAEISPSLPVLRDSHALPLRGQRVRGAALRADLILLGAAPRRLGVFVKKIYQGPEGLTADMTNGLIVFFGDDTRPHAKWLSLARVLAAPSSAGARYIDVRLPQRPAAGTDLTPVGAGGGKGAREGRAALASSLDEAVGAGMVEG